MGLTNFWKKKASDQSAVPSSDNQQPFSDLPAIDGNSAGNFDGSNVQNYGNISQLPSLDNSSQGENSKSISFNVPTFDFSLPPSDDEPEQMARPRASINDLAPPTPPSNPTSEATPVDPEDLNKLFITDPDWKEPDWNNFDPYPDEKIEEPTPSDFGETDLPEFDENANDNQPLSTEPIAEPAQPFRDAFSPTPKPMELFIRGRAYSRVFTELDQMNKTLGAIDSQLDKYEEMLKREEPLLNQAKDQMEYLYRRISQVDKKVFTQ